MEPPTPPTDSLYKFFALSGVAISIVTMSLGTLAVNNLRDRVFSEKQETAVLKVEIDDMHEKVDALKKQRNDMQVARDRLYSKALALKKEVEQRVTHTPYNDRQAKQFEHAVGEIRAQQSDIKWHDKQIEIAADKIAVTFLEQRKKLAALGEKSSEIDELIQEERQDTKSEKFMAFFGVLEAALGFLAWYLLLQRHIDEDTISPFA